MTPSENVLGCPRVFTFHPWYIHPWYSVVMVLFTIIGPCGVKMINVSCILHACANKEKNIQNEVIVLIAWLPACGDSEL